MLRRTREASRMRATLDLRERLMAPDSLWNREGKEAFRKGEAFPRDYVYLSRCSFSDFEKWNFCETLFGICLREIFPFFIFESTSLRTISSQKSGNLGQGYEEEISKFHARETVVSSAWAFHPLRHSHFQVHLPSNLGLTLWILALKIRKVEILLWHSMELSFYFVCYRLSIMKAK